MFRKKLERGVEDRTTSEPRYVRRDRQLLTKTLVSLFELIGCALGDSGLRLEDSRVVSLHRDLQDADTLSFKAG
jgi:hypothetical protein